MANVVAVPATAVKLELELNSKEAEQLKSFMQNANNDYEEPEMRNLRQLIWTALNDQGVK